MRVERVAVAGAGVAGVIFGLYLAARNVGHGDESTVAGLGELLGPRCRRHVNKKFAWPLGSVIDVWDCVVERGEVGEALRGATVGVSE